MRNLLLVTAVIVRMLLWFHVGLGIGLMAYGIHVESYAFQLTSVVYTAFPTAGIIILSIELKKFKLHHQ